MAIKTYHNGSEIRVSSIRIWQRLNTISSADIVVEDPLNEYTFNFLDEIEIKKDDKTSFRGFIVQAEKIVEDDYTEHRLFVCDPLYKLKLDRISGGIVSRTNDILQDLCESIGITNAITVKDPLTIDDLPFRGRVLVYQNFNNDWQTIVNKFSNYETLPENEKLIQYADKVSDIWVDLNCVITDDTHYEIRLSNFKYNGSPTGWDLRIIATNVNDLHLSAKSGLWWTKSYSDSDGDGVIFVSKAEDGLTWPSVLWDATEIAIGGKLKDNTQPVHLYVCIIDDYIEAKISLYFEEEITKYELLKELAKYHLFNFYYDPKTNSLRAYEQNYGDEVNISNITKYVETFRDNIQNRLKIRNYR